MNYVPYVIDNTNGHEYHSDLFSRLLSSRIIILSGEVDDDMASLAVAQLLYWNLWIRIRISRFILIAQADPLQRVWQFTTPCSM